jgi:diguanylate cyclase (GGDEF)-like protein/PAS domain S-box-containing protein
MARSVKRAEDRLKKLNECLLGFGSNADENINRLVALCGEVLGGTCALYNRLQGDLLCSLGRWQTPRDYKTLDKVEGHICFDVIQQGGDTPMVIRDLQRTPYARTDPNVVFYNLKTYVGIAVKWNQVAVGSLCVVYQSDVKPSPEDLEYMGIVASAIGVEEERKRAVEEVHVQKKLLENLVAIAHATAERPTLDATLQNVLEIATAVTGAENGDLILLDEVGTVTRCIIMPSQVPPESYEEVATRVIDRGLAGWVFRHRQAALIPDTSQDERWLFVPEVPYTIRSALSVPILSGTALVGVLTLVHSQPGRFDDAHLHLMQAAADQMALALRNAQIFETQRRMRAFNENIVQSMEEGIFIEDETGHATFVNPKTAELLGYTLEELIGKHWTEIVLPEEVAKIAAETDKRPRGIASHYETTLLARDGRRVPIIVSARPLFDAERFAGVLTVFTDITARKQAEEALHRGEERWRMYIEQANDLIFGLDPSGRINMVNQAACRTLGYTPEELIGTSPLEFIVPETLADAAAALARVLKGENIEQFEIAALTKDGRRIIIDVRGRSLHENGQFVGTFHIARDITERRQTEERLMYLSSHDALTGLYNRAFFEEELARLEHGRQFPISILMADVDGLKATNDREGHAAGDELLRRAAQVLRSAFRAEDVIARIGGDEFAVLLPDADAATGEQALSRLRDGVALHNSHHPDSPLSFSLGIAMGEKGAPLAEVLKEADRRMYQDKFSRPNNGRG